MKTPSTLLSHNRFRTLRRVGFSWAAAFIVLMILTFGVFVVLAGTNGSWNADVSDVWSNSARWLSNNIADGAGATGNFTFNITATRTITIDGAVASRTLGILNIGDTNASNSYTIAASGGGTLTFDNTPNSANAQLNNTSTSGANNTISAPILLNSSLDISNASANNLTLSGTIGSSATSGTQTISLLSGNATSTGVISNGATGGTLALAKSGAGTFTLNTATNTYSGGTSINSGTISFNNKDSLGSGTVTLGTAGGGSATLTTSTGVTLIPNNIVVASGSGGTLTLGSTSTSSGSYGVSAGTSTLTLNGDLSLTAAGTTNPLTMNSLISGAGALTKVGVGIATMSNANTYSGGTTISVGTLQFAVNGVVSGGVISTGPVGKGTLTFSDGVTLRSNGATARTIQNNLSLSGNITLGDATNTGALTFNSTDGTNTLTTAATATLTGNTMLTTPSAVTIADVISGNFTLTKAGASTLTLSGANTYSGNTTISAGTLALSGSGSFASSPTITVAGGATFDVSGLSSTLTLGNSQTLNGTGTSSSGTIKCGASGLTMGSTSPLTLSYASGNPTLTVTGGALTLASGNPVTVTTTSALGAGSYTLISAGAGGSVAGTAPTSLTVNGSGLASGTAASLQITGSQLILQVVSTTGKYRSRQSGNWNDFNTWQTDTGSGFVNAVSGQTPTSAADTIEIQNTHTVTVTANVDADQLTVDSGGTLSVNNGVTFTIADGTGTDLTDNGTVATAGNITNNGQAVINNTLQIDEGGFPGSGTGTYSYDQTNGVLVFNNSSGSYAVNNNNYWPTTNGPQNVTVQNTGGITMNVSRTVGLLFQTAKGVTISSGNTLTLNGTCQINTNGFFLNSPTYGSSSLLKYNTGGTYGRAGEWLPGATSNPGYPANVQLSNNTTLNLANGSSTQPFQMSGSLTVDSGSKMDMAGATPMTAALNVLGSVVNNGTVALSTSAGGDIKVGGNWTNNGTFTPNSRTATFNGTTNQSISGTSPTAFATLAISNTGSSNNNSVTLSQNISDTALNITSGIFDQGTSFNVSSGAVTVSSGATFKNLGTGDLTLSGDVSNSGTINFNANGTPCGDPDDISISSSVGGTQRTWSGTGTFSMTDVTVQDQTTGVGTVILVRNGTNAGNNGSGWVFVTSCSSGTYTWVGGLNADWQDPTSWSPTRTTPNPADVLIFDGSITPSPIVSDVPTQTIAVLSLINSTFVTLNASTVAPPQTLTISGTTGSDLSVPVNNRLTLAGSSALKINIASGSNGVIGGGIIFQDGAHRLLGNAANAITFNSGGFFTTASGFTGNAFGTGGAGDGAPGSVIFASGSTYFHNAGSSPFGTSSPAVTIFQTGSEADFFTATGFEASGRTYANLGIGAIDPSGVAVTIIQSGAGSFQFDTLNINSTNSATSSLTYTGTGSSTVTIHGSIFSNGTGDGITTNDLTLTAAGGIFINGGSTQELCGTSTRTATFGSNATVSNSTTFELERNLIVTPTSSSVLTISSGSSLSAGTPLPGGYVIGNLKKTLTNGGSATFEVGTTNGYSPVSLANINGSAPFTVLATNAYMAGITDPTQAIQRYWTLTNGGITSADVTFQYVSGLTPTGDETNTVAANRSSLNAFRRNGNGSINELTVAPSDRVTSDPPSVTVRGVNAFSDWTLAIGGSQVTFARLRSFSAINTSGGNLLQWQTSYEVNNVGFNLYRMEGHNLVRVTPSMVAGSALLAGPRTILTAGMSYSWRDAKGLPDSEYYLEDVDLNGTRTMNGPIVPVPAESGKVSIERQAMLLNELNTTQASRPAAITAGPAAQFTHTASGSSDPQANEPNPTGKKTKTLNATSASGSSGVTQNEQLAEQRAIAAGQAVKIAVKQAGWYRVTQAELVAAGLPANVDPQLLQLYADGVEQPILVSGSNPKQFGTDAAIEFYGTGLDTQMTDTRIYWLVVGTQPGKRVNIQSAQANQGNQSKGGNTTNATSAGTTTNGSQIMMELPTRSYAYTVERKDRTIYFTALLNGDADNFFGSIITSTPTTQNLSLSDVDQLVSGPATLEIALQGGTVQPHQVKVSYNGIEMGTISLKGQEHTVNQIQIPRPYLMEGNNTVTLESLGGDSDISVVDYVRLTYYHTYRAENDALTFSSPYTSPMMINGFTTQQVRVFDITNPNAVVQVDTKVHQKGTDYVVNVPEGNANRILMAVADSRVQHPASITANTPSNLTSSDNRADFVILTHPSFRDAVTPLADLRRSQGLETMVVNIEDVYDEFSYGAPSRDAIRDFFAYATHNWAKAPRYVLLVGDASLDPRNYLNTNHQDFVPTKLIDTSLLTTASDDALVDFDGDGIADISIGRLPAQTLNQAQKMIAKITSYVPGQSGTGALLVSDHNEGYDFEGATNTIHALLPANMPVVTIDRGERPPDQVRSEIVAGINQGPMIVNYAGHGSVEVWTGSGILRSDDATALTNGNKVPFFVTMTCLNGFFQDVYTESLAESLMKADGGGAVAVWASSGLTEPDPQALMDQQLMRLLFSNGQSPMLGDAVRGAKQATTDLDVRRTWILFGDPTMRIR
jgi:autotransporter-associated beta strand protein